MKRCEWCKKKLKRKRNVHGLERQARWDKRTTCGRECKNNSLLTKRCLWCWQQLERGENETTGNWTKRIMCGRRCAALLREANRKDEGLTQNHTRRAKTLHTPLATWSFDQKGSTHGLQEDNREDWESYRAYFRSGTDQLHEGCSGNDCTH